MAAVLALGLGVHAGHHPIRHHHHPHYSPGCNTQKCSDIQAKRWRKHHPLPVVEATAFDLCVANNEEGEPGARTIGTVNWGKEQGIYGGGFSEEDGKWLAAGGGKYSPHPWEATAMQQIATFHQSGRNGEWTLSNWPTIGKGCEGLPGSTPHPG